MLNHAGNSYITRRKQLCHPPDTVMSHRIQLSGADPGIYVRGGGAAPWIGEGSGDHQRPKRVQGSARWGALGVEAPRKLMRIRNLRR